jgi:CrcB protein
MSRRSLPWTVLGAISLGGTLGALARYGLAAAFPAPARGFPWVTFAVNTSGCLLIGVLMVLAARLRAGRNLVRPLLGPGLLGGYTTFSTYAVEVHRLARDGAAGTAAAYLLGTVGAAVVAVYAGSAVTRAILVRSAEPARST